MVFHGHRLRTFLLVGASANVGGHFLPGRGRNLAKIVKTLNILGIPKVSLEISGCREGLFASWAGVHDQTMLFGYKWWYFVEIKLQEQGFLFSLAVAHHARGHGLDLDEIQSGHG